MRWLFGLMMAVSVCAQAERIDVYRDSRIPKVLAERVIGVVARRFKRETGIGLRYGRVRALRLWDAGGGFPGDALEEFNVIGARRTLVMVVSSGRIAGQAEICGRRAVGSFAKWDFRKYPGGFEEMTEALLMHEVGHLFGATHEDDGSVMEPGSVRLGFSDRSKEEIRNCYGG